MIVYFKDSETMVIETEDNKVEVKIKDKTENKNLKLEFQE
jgi:hypothetical protein